MTVTIIVPSLPIVSSVCTCLIPFFFHLVNVLLPPLVFYLHPILLHYLHIFMYTTSWYTTIPTSFKCFQVSSLNLDHHIILYIFYFRFYVFPDGYFKCICVSLTMTATKFPFLRLSKEESLILKVNPHYSHCLSWSYPNVNDWKSTSFLNVLVYYFEHIADWQEFKQ